MEVWIPTPGRLHLLSTRYVEGSKWKHGPRPSNLLPLLQGGDTSPHKSFSFLFSLINLWLLCRVSLTRADLWQKEPSNGFQSPLTAGLTARHEILLQGRRLLTWLMKLYLNLEDLGLQRHFSLLRASRMKGVCYLYQTPRLKWFANWPLCNRLKVSC